MIVRFAMTVWRAVTDASSYVSDFAARRGGSAVGYLYFLCVTLAFFGLLPFAVGLAVFAPRSHSLADEQLDVIDRWYPDDLVVTVSGGVLTTNQRGPVILDLPPEWENNDHPEWKHFAVIDTEGTVDGFDEAETFLLFTSTSAVARDDDGTLRVFQFAEMDDEDPVTLDNALVTEAIGYARGVTPSLPWIGALLVLLFLLVLPWVIGGFAWLGELLFLTWATLVVRLCSAAMGRGLRYGALYKLGAFGVTGSMLLAFVGSMTGLELPLVPTLLFFAWMVFVLSKFPHSKATRTIAPPPPASAVAQRKPAAKKTPAKKPATKKK